MFEAWMELGASIKSLKATGVIYDCINDLLDDVPIVLV